MTKNDIEPSLEVNSPPDSETDIPVHQIRNILPELESQRRVTRELFQERIQEAGGSRAWLSRECPKVSVLAPTSLSDADLGAILLSNTQAFWHGVDARFTECDRCPPEGGACADSLSLYREGTRIRLRVVGTEASEKKIKCDRYQDFTMARRLVACGVSAIHGGVKFSSLGDVAEGAVDKFSKFVGGAEYARAPRKVELLIEGRRAREYGVALFRNTMKLYPNASFRSVHVPTLIRACRSAMTAKDASPLGELLTIDVLMLDGVDTASVARDSYFATELTWVYESRRDQGLATIITSLAQVRGAFPGVGVLRV